MIGYHAVPVIADAYMKGIRGFDAGKALAAMTASAEYGPYGGLEHYMKLGYVPIDREPEAASKTVEYAFDDWTIARMAEKMGKKDIATNYYKRAQNYRNVFDKETGFIRARKRWVLMPIIIFMLLLGMLMVLTQGSALAPFIYTIF